MVMLWHALNLVVVVEVVVVMMQRPSRYVGLESMHSIRIPPSGSVETRSGGQAAKIFLEWWMSGNDTVTRPPIGMDPAGQFFPQSYAVTRAHLGGEGVVLVTMLYVDVLL